MYEISKSFEFSAAHSVHSQKLDKRWAKNTYPKCRRLPGHGHNYKLTVYLSSENLDNAQMVTDFGHLWWLKEFIDNFVDHKLILGADDPALKLFLNKLGILKEDTLSLPEEIKSAEVKVASVDENFKLNVEDFKKVNFKELERLNYFTFFTVKTKGNSPIEDFYARILEGLAFINCSPTSENLARFFYFFVKENVKPLNVKCQKVAIQETPTSNAVFYENER
jgi:6-pyruvoyltetrahydropterin/6-carboxytetrahydropterin synthase